MPKQVKLNTNEIKACSTAVNGLHQMGWWGDTPQGSDYWRDIVSILRAKIEHGTSDGKPYAKPTPTEEDALQRRMVECRDNDGDAWVKVKLVAVTDCPNYPYIVVYEDSSHEGFKQCRYLREESNA